MILCIFVLTIRFTSFVHILSRVRITSHQELYVSSNKRDKMAISRSIVEAVRARKPPGRFLEKDPDRNLWFDIGDKKAIEKTSQALRDGAAAYRKQLSDEMSDPNFLEAVFDEEGEGGHSNSGVSRIVKGTIRSV